MEWSKRLMAAIYWAAKAEKSSHIYFQSDIKSFFQK
jgi:hypothetical protein